MLRRFSLRSFPHPRAWAFYLSCLLALFCSCGLKEPPLSPAAQKLKSEISKELKEASAALIQPLVGHNVEGANKVLAESFLRAEKTGAPLPAGMGVLDPAGFVLTRYPAVNGSGEQFSDYRVFKEVTQTKRIGKQVLYRADGSQDYVILAPLLSGRNLVGLFALLLRVGEVQDKWQVSSQELLVMDFNK